MGVDCRIYSFNVQSEPWLVQIGNRVTIASGVQLVTHDGATWLAKDDQGRRYRYDPITIGDDVFLGVNAIIMPGVIIGSRVIVAAGAVVTQPIPEGAIVAGVPAQCVGSYDEYVQRALTTLEHEQARAFASAEREAEARADSAPAAR